MARQGTVEVTIILLLAFATSASAQLIDDFESYIDTSELQAVWSFASELDAVTPTPGAGTQSLRRVGFSPGDGSGLTVFRDFDPPLDLSERSGLEVWVRRDPASVSTLRFTISAEDGGGNSCAPQGVPLISDTAWHRSLLSFPDFCGAVNVSDISRIFLGVTNMSGGPGDIVANFDDLTAPFEVIFEDGFETGETSNWSSTTP